MAEKGGGSYAVGWMNNLKPKNEQSNLKLLFKKFFLYNVQCVKKKKKKLYASQKGGGSYVVACHR